MMLAAHLLHSGALHNGTGCNVVEQGFQEQYDAVLCADIAIPSRVKRLAPPVGRQHACTRTSH